MRTAEGDLQDLKPIDVAVRPADPCHLWLLLARFDPFLNLLYQFKKIKMKGLSPFFCWPITSLSKIHHGASRQFIAHPFSQLLPHGQSRGWDSHFIIIFLCFLFHEDSIPRAFPKCVQSTVNNLPWHLTYSLHRYHQLVLSGTCCSGAQASLLFYSLNQK